MSQNQGLNPGGIAPPFSTYSHGVLVPPGARRLYVSGQVGVRPDGTLAEGFEAQAAQAWENLLAVLAEADMGAGDLVKITALLTRPRDVPAYRAVRDRCLGEVRPASTLMIVAGLANEDWLIEVEAVAARAP